MSGLERIFHVHPAYDCIGVQPCVHGSERCKPGTGGSHGRHNAEMHLTVRGADAEVTLVISTGWDLPTVPAHHRLSRDGGYPRGAFVELHTARPRYEGQDGSEPRPDGTCKNWAACYVDTSYSMSDEPTRLLVEKGSDVTWAWLEALYADVQADMDKVDIGPSYRPLGEGTTRDYHAEEQTMDALKPGHYVTTDFLKNEGCVVIAGPFPTQDEAREHRGQLEDRDGHHSYFLETVRG